MMNTDSAMDLSTKTRAFPHLDKGGKEKDVVPIILRPTPRPPWSIIWYQNLWPSAFRNNPTNLYHHSSSTTTTTTRVRPSTATHHHQHHNSISYGGPMTHRPTEETQPSSSSVVSASSPPSSSSHLIEPNLLLIPHLHSASDQLPKSSAPHQFLPWKKQQHVDNKESSSSSLLSSSPPYHSQDHSLNLPKQPPPIPSEELRTDTSSGGESRREEAAPYHNDSNSSSESHKASNGSFSSSGRTDGQNRLTKRTPNPGVKAASSLRKSDSNTVESRIVGPETTPSATIVDIACCDGPVHFERISNPNFALTVEHQQPAAAVTVAAAAAASSSSSSEPLVDQGTGAEKTSNATTTTPNTSTTTSYHQQHEKSHDLPSASSSLVVSTTTVTSTLQSSSSNTNTTTMTDHGSSFSTTRSPATKTYLCIYCNQSFKSLFCYQKHKKRHLNPVSVDITGINVVNAPTVYAPENNVRTKDLNVQFFPCKKCGCKFPSYYFVHKHKKTCHSS